MSTKDFEIYCVSCEWPLAEGLERIPQDLFFRANEKGSYLCGVRDPDLKYLLTDERQIGENFGTLIVDKGIEELLCGEKFEIKHIGLGIVTRGKFIRISYKYGFEDERSF